MTAGKRWKILLMAGFSLPILCIGETHEDHPTLIAEINLGSTSKFAINGTDVSHSIPHINFGSDSELAISTVASDETPPKTQEEDQNRPKHLFVEWYTLRGASLVPTRQDKFDAASVHDSITMFPSGRSLVNANRRISVYSAGHQLEVGKPVEDVCGKEAVQPEGSFYDSYALATSDEFGVTNLLWQHPTKKGFVDEHHVVHPTKTPASDSFYCWFKADDLHPAGTIRVVSFPLTSAFDLNAYSGQPGFTESITPSGSRKVSPPSGCEQPAGMIEMRRPYLLRSGYGVATMCTGKLVIEKQEKQESVKLSVFRALPNILTDAWSAPVLVLVSGEVKVGRTFNETERYEIINYKTGEIEYLPQLKTEVGVQIFTGEVSAVAVSPTGKYLAVLYGSHLALYATNLVDPKVGH
jgi:hypothetical protein